MSWRGVSPVSGWQFTASLCFYTVFAATAFVREGFNVSLGVTGLTLTAMMLGYTALLFVTGAATDAFGERPLLVYGLLALSAGMTVVALSPSFPVLLVSLLFVGFAYATAGIGGLILATTQLRGCAGRLLGGEIADRVPGTAVRGPTLVLAGQAGVAAVAVWNLDGAGVASGLRRLPRHEHVARALVLQGGRDAVGDLLAELPFREVEREVDPAGDATRGHDLAAIDDTGVSNLDARRPEVLGGRLVSDRRPVAEQASAFEQHRARTDRGDGRTSLEVGGDH